MGAGGRDSSFRIYRRSTAALLAAAGATIAVFVLTSARATRDQRRTTPAGEGLTAPMKTQCRPGQAEGTCLMVQRLKELGKNSDLQLLEQRQDPHLARYVRNVKEPVDLHSEMLLGAKEAYDLLLLGQSQEAAHRFQRIKDVVTQNQALFDNNFANVVREYLAISYLRLGEQDNCLSQHSIDSCLLPITGSGVHTLQDGSRAAIREYAEILDENASNMTARWLLNVAYMTVEEYPAG